MVACFIFMLIKIFLKNQYIYSYTDHLGNVRLSYFKNTNGSAEVLEKNDYYPFGLKRNANVISFGDSSYNYQYNSKEYQKETGWSDYGARMYMSDIARWGVIDPLAETSRRFNPYNYAYNNPISFIDPDGRKALAVDEGWAWNVPTGSGWFNERRNFGSFEEFIKLTSSNERERGSGGGSHTTIGDMMRGLGVNPSESMDYYQAVIGVLSLRQRLINAGWDNPENISAKFNDWWKLVSSKGTSLNELYKITKAQFEEDPNINSPGATNWNLISINMSKNKNLLEYAFTIGHEMYGHAFANLFFQDKFSEITRISTSSPRTFKFFQEVMGIRWEMDQGATRYGDRSALDAAEFYYGGIGHGQSIIDRVRTDYTRLTYEWNKIYNIQKNKIK
jgi:RHS repeat-associated protein